MAVERIEEYRQQNGEEILKVILKPTKVFPEGYFYCDFSDEKLVRSYTWFLEKQKKPYVDAHFGGSYSQFKSFHREKAFNILSWYPDYINHKNGIEFDNIDRNLDVVSQQQNNWCKPSRGYHINGKSFQSFITINNQHKYAPCIRTESEACQSAYQLEMKYEDYHYEFLKDRRKDLDILDDERIGRISEDEAVYRHVLRHAADNAWYYYRYNLADYFKEYHLKVPDYALDEQGYMTHSITGQRLCPM